MNRIDRKLFRGFAALVLSILMTNIQAQNSLNKYSIKNDTFLLNKYCHKQISFIELNTDSALYYGKKALSIASRLHQKFYLGFINCDMAYVYLNDGDYTLALQHLIEATKLSESNDLSANIIKTDYIESFLQTNDDLNKRILIGWIKNSLGLLYGLTEDKYKSKNELLTALKIVGGKVNNNFLLAGISANIVSIYIEKNKLDSALYYQKLTMKYEENINRQTYNGVSNVTIGEIYFLQNKVPQAKEYILSGISQIKAQGEDLIGLSQAYVDLANLYNKVSQPDSGLYFANLALKSLKISKSGNELMLDVYQSLAANYHSVGKSDSAYFYQLLASKLGDSLSTIKLKNLGKFHSIGFSEKIRLKDLESAAIENRSKAKIALLTIVIGVCLIIAFILLRNNKIKQITNKKLQETLANLKETQTQLIQSEKMASLGELTAGIAHEIQNPLNFVNNFSEINQELAQELAIELNTGNTADMVEIIKDIISNSEKINHHGKRADAIVKGMLQHSRVNSGKKEPLDINALCDEYLRLSYHGIRAKDKSFNADFKTEFDKTIISIKGNHQDLGRVLLNLINNAFYACAERSRSAVSEKNMLWQAQGDNYEPTVIVSTKNFNDKIEIKVSDNGNGIPKNIIDKIFQPFFTTKPTGSGTGLGLSLSYDIVKAHGGEIRVNSTEGEGTEFIIQLPVV